MSYKVIMFTVGMNMVYLKSKSTITKIVSKLDKEESFSMKSIEIKFHRYLKIRIHIYKKLDISIIDKF